MGSQPSNNWPSPCNPSPKSSSRNSKSSTASRLIARSSYSNRAPRRRDPILRVGRLLASDQPRPVHRAQPLQLSIMVQKRIIMALVRTPLTKNSVINPSLYQTSNSSNIVTTKQPKLPIQCKISLQLRQQVESRCTKLRFIAVSYSRLSFKK